MVSSDELWKPHPDLRGYLLGFVERYGPSLRDCASRPDAETSYSVTHDGLFWNDEFPETLREDRDFQRTFQALISMRSLRMQGIESQEAAALLDEILSLLNGWAFCEPDGFAHDLIPRLTQFRRETYRGLLRLARECKHESDVQG